MGAIVPMQSRELTREDPRRVALFVRTVGKDLVNEEIDIALEYCKIYKANPLTRDIYFFCFGKYGTDKRQVVPVISIGKYRQIASDTGNYRPDERAPRFTYDEQIISPTTNPKGIVDCEVTVWRYSHGGWHPITERLRWEERAPLKEVWEDDKPTGRFVLDARKQNWRTMPETMLAKCVEVAAIRKGWPSETSGSYISEELDQRQTLELTAVEIVKSHEADQRMQAIGGPGRILIDWVDGEPLTPVPVGKFGDACLQFIREKDASVVAMWAERNTHGLREYWARDKDGCLAVKKAIEAKKSEPVAAE